MTGPRVPKSTAGEISVPAGSVTGEGGRVGSGSARFAPRSGVFVWTNTARGRQGRGSRPDKYLGKQVLEPADS